MLQDNSSGLSQGNSGLPKGTLSLPRGGGLGKGSGLPKGKSFPEWVNEAVDEVEDDDKIVFEDKDLAMLAKHFDSDKITPEHSKLMSDYSTNYAKYPRTESDWANFIQHLGKIEDGEIPDPRVEQMINDDEDDEDEDDNEPSHKKSILEEAKKANKKKKKKNDRKRITNR